jgi:diaminopimelate epimerase
LKSSEAAIKYATGHGTGNDFVVIADAEAVLTVSPTMARKICDRESGVGADGLLVATLPSQAERTEGVDVVMGYLNADGSPAEMCGNGIRVLVAYAKEMGWVFKHADPVGETVVVKTPSGLVSVTDLGKGEYQVAMGKAEIGDLLSIEIQESLFQARAVHVPNPHAVAFVNDLASLGGIAKAPTFTPADAFPQGANVEFVERLGKTHARIVIYERGSGLTQSCGTGACAVAAILATTQTSPDSQAAVSAGTYQIEVPGGVLSVIVDHDLGVKLIGPAVITGHGQFDRDWWRQNS